MSNYNQDLFREWVLKQESDLYEIEEINDAERTVTFLAPKHTTFIKFFFNDIVELYIRRNGNDENLYYLHFQANDEEYCTKQFKEMLKFFKELVDEKVIKIMLTCSSGMTTSLFALKLNELAEIMKLNYKFDACNYKSIIERGIESSIILVAPQIANETEWIKEVSPEKIVIDIPTNIFAAMKTAELMDIIRDAIKEQENKKNAYTPATIENVFKNDLKILVVGIIRTYNTVYYPYDIFDKGIITLQEEMIKTTYDQDDIVGLLDYLTAEHKDLDCICIASPGVTYHGFIGDINQDVEIIDFAHKYTKKYGIQVFLCNDVNAMAIGYRAQHKNCDNMLFYYQPFLSPTGGGGLIVDGKLVRGHLSVAGEMAATMMMMEPNYEDLRKTRDGVTKLITAALLSYIVTVGPEKIVVSSKMMPRAEDIRKEISTHINKLFVPEIRTTSNVRKYMLPGLMIYALDCLHRDYVKIAKDIVEKGLETEGADYLKEVLSGKEALSLKKPL